MRANCKKCNLCIGYTENDDPNAIAIYNPLVLIPIAVHLYIGCEGPPTTHGLCKWISYST